MFVFLIFAHAWITVLQASTFVTFVPYADECYFMQHFISKMYIEELINEEQHQEQQKLKETMLRIDKSELKNKEEHKKT